MHLEHVHAAAQPLARDVAHLRGRRRRLPLGDLLVDLRIADEHLPAGEHVGLSAEAADTLEPPDEGCARLRLHAVELGGRGAGRQELAKLLVERALDRRELRSRLRRGPQQELRSDLAHVGEADHIGGDAILVHEPLVETRRLAVGERVERELEERHVARAPRRHVPHLVETRLRHAVLHRLPVLSLELGDPRLLRRYRRTRRDVAEVALDPRPNVLGLHVAGNDERRVGRTVVAAEPVLHIVERCGVEILHRPDDRPRVRMPLRIGVLGDEVEDLAVRLVLPHALLVLHDAALLVQPGGVDRAEQVAHAIGLEPEHAVERRDGNVLEVVGAVLVRGAIEVGGA